MAILTLQPFEGEGVDVGDFDIRDIGEYEEATLTPTMADFHDLSDNYIRLLGSDITYVTSGDTLEDVTGGTVTEIIVAYSDTQVFHFTGLNLSAATLFDFYQADDADGAREYVLSGADAINGTSLADILYGGAGNDLLSGGAGADTLNGGAGDDTYGFAGYVADTIIDSSGNDTITSTITRSLAAYSITENVIENITLLGTADIDAIGNSIANVLTGNSGNNILNGSAGADTLIGGAGDDTYVFSGFANDTIDDSSGIDTITTTTTRSLAGYATIENLTLIGGNTANLTGNGLDNVLTGNGADNTLTGGDGDDTLNGGAGADTLNGGANNDTYILGANTPNKIIDNSGVDTIITTITRSLTDYGMIENLTLIGSDAADLTGNSLNNKLIGNSAANVLAGGAGADTLNGGDGNDTYVFAGYVADTIIDSSGTDTITTTITRSLVSYGMIENLFLLGSKAGDLTGNGLANMLIGNGADNILTGGGGTDTLDGGGGNDTYVFAGYGGDKVIDTSGTDTITTTISRSLAKYSRIENLTLLSTGAINATGNDLANVLTGNSNNNILAGGAGNDTLIGGDGNDSFLFNSAPHATTNVDTITDFNAAGETVQLDNVIFTAFTSDGAISSTMFRSNATGIAKDGDDFLIYDNDNGDLYYDADGSGAGTTMLMAHLTGNPALTYENFLIV